MERAKLDAPGWGRFGTLMVDLTGREVGRVADSFGLQQMPAFVANDDLESGADSESNSRRQRIPKAYAINVLGARAEDEFAAGFVTGEESIDDREVHLRRRPDLGGSGNTLAGWGGLNKVPEKPPPEPPWSNLLDR